MAVLIFPVKSVPHPDNPKKLRIPDAGVVQRGLAALGHTPKNNDPLYREGKGGKFKARGLALAGQPAPIEDRLGAANIWVHPSLPFTAADIADEWSFGNGVTCGGIGIKSGPLAGQTVPCAWVVVDDADEQAVKSKVTQIQQLFQVV